MSVEAGAITFVGGLHRSGTTLVANLLGEHPSCSGLTGTGVPKDEGQHVQTVIPPARAYGGPGRFAYSESVHLTEDFSLAEPSAGEKMFREWSNYWDCSKPALIEKSPPNILRTRFLQSLFPGSRFVIVVRHPAICALATRKWVDDAHPWSLIKHWIRAHEVFEDDATYIDNLLVVHYEELVRGPDSVCERLYRFIGVDPIGPPVPVDEDASAKYIAWWNKQCERPVIHPKRLYMEAIMARFARSVNAFGYSLRNLGYLRLDWARSLSTDVEE